MAITVTNKTSGGQATAATSISSASISPSANTILVVGLAGRKVTGPTQPSVSGLSLTWNHVAGQVWATTRRLDVFWALVGSSPGSGALTFQWGTTHDAVWVVDQISEADADGTIQSNTATTTGLTVEAALGALRDSQSLVWAAFASTSTSFTWTPEGGASESAEASGDHSLLRIAGHYKTNDATVTGTVSSSSAIATVAVEFGISAHIKAGKGTSAFRVSGVRGSGGIVFARTGSGKSALRASGYKMPVNKTGKASSALRASGTALERDSGITKYLEGKILDWLFTGAALAVPSSLYLGLFTAAPDTVAGGTECSGNGYARARFSNAPGSWGEPAAGAIALATCVGFPVATGSWGTITAIGVWDASSSGNLWAWRPISPTYAITSGELVVVEPGDLAMALD